MSALVPQGHQIRMRSDERDKLSHFVITLVTLCNKLEMDGRRASKPKDKGAFHSTQNPEIWVGSSNGTDNFGLVRGPRWITPSEICLILHILRKSNSLIALLFIQIIPSLKTYVKHAYLHRC